MSDQPPLLTLTDVRFGFDNKPDFLGPISMDVRPGDCWGILGPNGAGKSTLLRLLMGLLEPSGGYIFLRGRRVFSWSSRDRARQMAYVPQHAPVDLGQTARDVVLLGRYPHRSLGLFESPRDGDIADAMMRETQTDIFADRAMDSLSGGEARRVHLAAALAQESELLVLDEPTSSLDLRHEMDVFETLRRRVESGKQAVIVVTHDVNLAARFCTYLMLLSDGACVAQGPPEEILRPEALALLYGVRMDAVQTDDGASHWYAPIRSRRGRSS